MRIACFEITFLYLVIRSASFPIEDADDDDESSHLGHVFNGGSPLYYDTDHHHEYDDYPGYDGYASYAPNHDHEHYAYPRYKFEYGVHDPHTGDIKKQYEERDGDVVRGFYSLVEPDGSIRIVEYTADDKHGFQATVKKIGPSHHPPTVHQPPVTHHEEHYPNPHNDHYPSYPHNDVSNHYPHYPYPHHDDEDYGYNGYENGPQYPNFYGYGVDHNNAYYHYGLGGQEYDEEDYPYHSNNIIPTYILPQHTYSSIQDLTAYGGSAEDIDYPNKFYHKRSPIKKIKDAKTTTKPLREAKKLDVTEESKQESAKSTTQASVTAKSQDKKD